MIEINESNFETEVLVRSHEMPVLVDFWADWCAPCKSLMPVLDKLYTDYQGQLQIVKINTDEQRSLAEVNGIRSLQLCACIVTAKWSRKSWAPNPNRYCAN